MKIYASINKNGLFILWVVNYICVCILLPASSGTIAVLRFCQQVHFADVYTIISLMHFWLRSGFQQHCFYHFVVVLELKENHGADFWQARLNNNRNGNEILTDQKNKKRDNLIQFLIKHELLKNLQSLKFSSKVYKAICYLIQKSDCNSFNYIIVLICPRFIFCKEKTFNWNSI